VIANEIFNLDDFLRGYTKDSTIHIYLRQESHNSRDINMLKDILFAYPGSHEAFLHLLNHETDTVIFLGGKYRICQELQTDINRMNTDVYVKYIN